MRKAIVTLTCLFGAATLPLGAQKAADEIKLRVQYSSTYQRTMEEKPLRDVNMLEIGTHMTKFYSPRYVRYRRLSDSLQNATADPAMMLEFIKSNGDLRDGQTYAVYRGYPKNRSADLCRSGGQRLWFSL